MEIDKHQGPTNHYAGRLTIPQTDGQTEWRAHPLIEHQRRLRPSLQWTSPSGQRCVLKHFSAYPLIKMREMRGGNLSTAIATFGGRYARELFWCYSWLYMPSWSFLYIKLKNFMHFLQKRDIPTDGWTDQRTDTPSYRDARMHLKRGVGCVKLRWFL